MDIDTEILGIALRNALFHGGRADVGAVMSKVLGAHPELRKDVKNVTERVKKIVKEVNALSVDAQTEEAAKLGVSLEREEKHEREGLPDLPGVRDAFITRFAPNPNAPLHLGNARALVLSGLYAKKYSGKLILRYDDTDPRTKTPIKEAYEWILEDMRWLGFEPDLIVYASDRLEIYYAHAAELIRKGGAYVCTCEIEEWRRKTLKGVACPCRSLDAGKHENRWVAMLDGGYREGEAVVRVKTDLTHANPAVRDWPAFRIIEGADHPRVGSRCRVWPLYNFASAIDDHDFNVTHLVRGQEHTINTERQSYLFKHMNWTMPVMTHHGRLAIKGFVLSKSQIGAMLKKKIYSGWDDPRLGTLRALRRRGFQPQTLVHVIEQMGIKPSDATLALENLVAENKRHVDFTANRYYFVGRPVKMTLAGEPKKEVAEIPLHPEDEARGTRKLRAGKTVFIDESDAKEYDGREVRLKGLFNVKIDTKNKTLTYTGDALSRETQKIHWVPKEMSVNCTVVMDDGSELKGVAEKNVMNETVGTVVQFERFGFVRIDDKKEDALVCYFAHE